MTTESHVAKMDDRCLLCGGEHPDIRQLHRECLDAALATLQEAVARQPKIRIAVEHLIARERELESQVRDLREKPSFLRRELRLKYPSGYARLTAFCEKYPELLPLGTARKQVNEPEGRPDEVLRCFKKRLGSWYINVEAFVDLMENDDMVVGE